MTKTIKIDDTDPVLVVDHRPDQPEPTTIPATSAELGKLYLTDGGCIVMAALMPATGYEKAFPDAHSRLFVYPDGRAFPHTSERLTPIKGAITWSIEEI